MATLWKSLLQNHTLNFRFSNFRHFVKFAAELWVALISRVLKLETFPRVKIFLFSNSNLTRSFENHNFSRRRCKNYLPHTHSLHPHPTLTPRICSQHKISFRLAQLPKNVWFKVLTNFRLWNYFSTVGNMQTEAPFYSTLCHCIL